MIVVVGEKHLTGWQAGLVIHLFILFSLNNRTNDISSNRSFTRLE
jgi:hypothetical protein